MKTLVACPLPDFALAELRGLGTDLTYAPSITPEALSQEIVDTGILVVTGKAVTPEMLERAEVLQMVVYAGSGSGQIAVDAASRAGIFVTHCPGTDALACAELTLGLLLALDRSIVPNANRLREGQWSREDYIGGRGLAGRTLGIIGDPPFCKALARLARALDMEIIAWLPETETDVAREPDIELCNWPREVARRSDAIVVHGATAQGRAMAVDEQTIDSVFLDSLKQDALLVHLGDISALDEEAITRAIDERGMRLALDVAPTGQTGRAKTKLLQKPGVIGTIHTGGATEEARHAIAREVVAIISAFLISGEIRHPVNLAERSPATWLLVLRIRDQVGVMAGVLQTIRADGINAEEITSRVFMGAQAAWCTISLDERPSTEALNAIRAMENVLHLELRAVV